VTKSGARNLMPSAPVSASHTRTTPLSPAEARRLPFGEHRAQNEIPHSLRPFGMTVGDTTTALQPVVPSPKATDLVLRSKFDHSDRSWYNCPTYNKRR
jgi:hypothetical protein